MEIVPMYTLTVLTLNILKPASQPNGNFWILGSMDKNYPFIN